MPIGTPVVIGSAASSDVTGSNSWALTLSAGASVGDRVWIYFAMDGSDATPQNPTFTVADSAGNTWSTITPMFRGPGVAGGTIALFASSCVVTNAMSAAGTITVSNAAANFGVIRKCLAAIKASGVDTVDENITVDLGSTSSLSIGPTAATDTAQELCLVAWAGGVRAHTASGSYTELVEIATVVGTTDRQLVVAYRIVTSTGAQTATGSLASATTAIGALSTWRATASVADDATHFLYDGADWQPMFAELL